MFIPILLFLLGLSVGSFLNVLIDRLPLGESVIKGRSYCDHCRHKLSWYDLIPLVSFILLGRRCRYCRALISWQYPVVELATAILFLASFQFLPAFTPGEPFQITSPVVSLVYLLIAVSGLIVIFFTDLKYRIIPDQVVIFLGVTSLLFLFFSHQPSTINHLLSGMVVFLIFLLLAFITRGRGMGLGDVKFAFCMGLILGFPKILIAFYLSFLTGAIFSLILLILGKKTMKSTIPFGPFLVVSTMVSLFCGESLWGWFKGILGI